MAVRNTPEEKQLLQMIEKFPVTDDEKQKWTENIRSSGLSEELAEEIRKALTSPDAGEEEKRLKYAQYSIKLANLVRRWRLNQQFGKR